MSNISKPVKELLLERLRQNGGRPSEAARYAGVDFSLVRELLEPPAARRFQTAMGPEPEDIRTLGRDGHQKHVIAVKRAGSSWPTRFNEVIADARRKFDAGTHEMFQSNDDGWVVQYLIPHKNPVAPRAFFSTMGSVHG